MYEIDFLIALALTFAIEIPCLWVLIRFFLKQNKSAISTLRITGIGFLATFTTLPYVWFILRAFIFGSLAFVLSAEISVFVFEALLYIFLLGVKPWQGFILSLLCNGLSFGTMEIIRILT